MLDYDREARRYDETRGGLPRAQAAARALLDLLPPDARTLVDIGCGTGLVTQKVVRQSLNVIGLDPSAGMLGLARHRITAIQASGERLPLADASVDAVSFIWILHLIADPEPIIAEVGRVLRPGGTLITTVDKDSAHDVGSDIDNLLRPYRGRRASDDYRRISWYAGEHGLVCAGETDFIGYGQRMSPQNAAAKVRDGYFASTMRMDVDTAESLARDLESLPEQLTPRRDPPFRLAAFHRRQALASHYYVG